jgi:ankyrin repeat protein
VELDVFDAAAVGRADRLSRLLDAQPDLAGAWTPDGFTPLHLAAFFAGDPDTVALLLARGAPVDVQARQEMAVTPLGSACAAGHGAVARLLVEAGADPGSVQAGGYTPLHAAAAGGDAALARLLIAHGADPARPADDRRTPADLARERGHPKLAAWLEGA